MTRYGEVLSNTTVAAPHGSRVARAAEQYGRTVPLRPESTDTVALWHNLDVILSGTRAEPKSS
jgi:hypothetical protein